MSTEIENQDDLLVDIAELPSFEQLVRETFEPIANKSQKKENDPDFLLENAKLLEQNNEYDLARNIYQALLRKKAFMRECLEGLARTYEKQGFSEKAQQYYEASRRMQS